MEALTIVHCVMQITFYKKINALNVIKPVKIATGDQVVHVPVVITENT